jgi:hypothetical protein
MRLSLLFVDRWVKQPVPVAATFTFSILNSCSEKSHETSPLICVQVGQAAGASGRHLYLLYPELLLGEVLRGGCQREEDVWSLTWQLQGLS